MGSKSRFSSRDIRRSWCIELLCLSKDSWDGRSLWCIRGTGVNDSESRRPCVFTDESFLLGNTHTIHLLDSKHTLHGLYLFLSHVAPRIASIKLLTNSRPSLPRACPCSAANHTQPAHQFSHYNPTEKSQQHLWRRALITSHVPMLLQSLGRHSCRQIHRRQYHKREDEDL
jgi:hypothetical protein